MQHYFYLQYKMLNRKIVAFGLPAWTGYIVMLASFIALSYLVFMKLQTAEYVYMALAVAAVGSTSEAKRNEFLKNVFSIPNYRQIRWFENILIALPFAIYLCYEQEFLLSIFTLVVTSLLAVFQFRNEWNYALPTPFSKTPFEFLVGFRNTFWAYGLIWFLVIMGISVGNFNLSVFALLGVFLMALSYYSKPEEPFFVWMFNLSVNAFLFKKIKTAIIHSMILALPIAITLTVLYLEKWWAILGILLIGVLYLITIILAKYAAFPNEMSVPQGLILVFGIGLPPFLIFAIPYFYKKAKQQLVVILE